MGGGGKFLKPSDMSDYSTLSHIYRYVFVKHTLQFIKLFDPNTATCKKILECTEKWQISYIYHKTVPHVLISAVCQFSSNEI